MTPGARDPQLVLKATPPKLPKTLLARPRLSCYGPELADKPILLVHAPSGFGKTSLLAQWRREALQHGAVVAWLTLDDRDDGARIVQSLSVALSMSGGRRSAGPSYARADAQVEGDFEGITAWLADVAEMAVETVLVLDEAHALPEATASTILVYLLNNAPANLRVVVASRKPVGLPVSDMLAHGQVRSLDADDLRFRLTETIEILTARFGSRIDSDACVRLHDLTEGWPLGLQLAIATIERSANVREAIAAFSSRSGDIQRYFVECLVDRLPKQLADFLTAVSFVDALHPLLCEAITQGGDCAQALAKLRDATPIFVEGVDSEWSRIHPLARDFLKERFEALPAAERREFHARAASWLAGHELHEEAARQALRAGQDALAFDLIERSLYGIVVSGQMSRVLEWMERLPAAELERRSRLRLAAGWTFAQSDQHAEAAKLVGPIVADPAADPGDRFESAEICATAAIFADDMEGAERIFSPSVDSLASRSVMQRGVAANLLAVRDLYRGAPEQARLRYAQFSGPEWESVGVYTHGWGDWIVGVSYLWEGQVVLGEDALRASLARAEQESGRRSPIAVMLASALASVLWERDLTAEAAALLANRLDVLERRAVPEAIIMGYVTAARVATIGGLERRAYDLLDNLHALGEARGLPRLCVASLAEQIRMHALRSHAEACASLAGRLDRLTTPEQYARWSAVGALVQTWVGLARAYAAVVRQDWQQVQAELKAIGPVADGLRRGRDGIRIRLLRALALKRCGEDGDALFAEGVSLAETYGLERMLVDTHPDLVDWARRMGNARSGEAGATTTHRLAVPSAPAPARPAAGTHPHARVSPSALLTPKEREVLQLLAGNMSNKQIALALGVGVETVKWHMKNLFDKLNAGTRKHVLDRARMLGILDSLA